MQQFSLWLISTFSFSLVQFSSVQFSSVQFSRSVMTLCDPMNCSTPGSLSITSSRSSPKPTSIESVMPSSHLILCHPLILLPPIPPSIRVFSSESTLRMRVAKVLEFQLQHHSFQRTPRTDGLQNGLVGSPFSPWDSQESSPIPQFRSINTLALSFLHSPTLTSIHDHRKNHSLDRQTFVGKVMSLLFNMLSRLVITFLPRSKYSTISQVLVSFYFWPSFTQFFPLCLWRYIQIHTHTHIYLSTF